MPRPGWLIATALTALLGLSSATPTSLTGKTTGTTIAAGTTATGYTLVSNQPALEFASITVTLSLTLSTAADGAKMNIFLNAPTSSTDLTAGQLYQLMTSTASPWSTCTSNTAISLVFSSQVSTQACTGTVKSDNGMPTNSQKWSTVATGTIPTTATANQWLLIITPVSTTGTILLNSWSITIDTLCYTLVPNSVNLGTSTSSSSSGSSITLVCSTGFTATSTALTCGTGGFTAAACINGGGAVVTFGLNANPRTAGASAVIPLNILGRTSVASTAVHYDPNLQYMWLPNGVWATRVALGDLCTLVLSNAGVVYQYGYCGSPENTVFTTTTSSFSSGTIISLPGGAIATLIWATHFTFAALTPGNQLVVWGITTSATGAWNVLVTPLVVADWFCGFVWTATPTAVGGLPGTAIADVALAINRISIVTTAGEVYSWGCNSYFSLGSSYTGSSITATSQIVVTTPTKVTSTALPSTVMHVAMAEYQTIALTSSGQVYAWGVLPSTYQFSNFISGGFVPSPDTTYPGTTQLTTTNFLSPTLVDSTKTFSSIRASRWVLAGLTTGGQIYTWGYDYYPALLQSADSGVTFTKPTISTYTGMLGRGSAVSAGYDNLLGQVSFGTTTRTISTMDLGTTFGAAIDTNGNVIYWGNMLTDTTTLDTNPGGLYATWQWSQGSATVTQLSFPTGDNAMWIVAGRDSAAILDARNGASGCPSVGSQLTSQDVAFVSSMSNSARAKLVAGITSVSICGATNWVNSFLNVALVTAPYSLTMPSFSNGVTISITNFNKVNFMVASTYAPSGASIAAVGIVPAQGRQLLFLFQIDQMHLDSTMFSGNPLVVQVVVTNLAIVYIYNDGYRTGKQLTGAEGSITSSGTTYTLNLAHTSAVAGFGPYDSGDGSNEALLGLLGLIALPVICAIGLYVWLWYRYTHTEAVVEAANPVAPVFMMEPAPIVAPSPAYIPAAYPAAPAYYV